MPGHAYLLETMLGEASWLAVPFLNRDFKISTIIHLVRDPLKVVASLVTDGFLMDETFHQNLYSQFVKRYLPQVFDYDGMDRFLFFWIYWNRFVEDHRDFFCRIEDINKDPKKIFKDLGIEIGDVKLFDDKKQNSRPHKDIPLEELKDCEFYDEFINQAEKYGYKLK